MIQKWSLTMIIVTPIYIYICCIPSSQEYMYVDENHTLWIGTVKKRNATSDNETHLFLLSCSFLYFLFGLKRSHVILFYSQGGRLRYKIRMDRSSSILKYRPELKTNYVPARNSGMKPCTTETVVHVYILFRNSDSSNNFETALQLQFSCGCMAQMSRIKFEK